MYSATLSVIVAPSFHSDPGAAPASHVDASLDAARFETLASVTPRRGSALVFRHELLHEAAPVLSGQK